YSRTPRLPSATLFPYTTLFRSTVPGAPRTVVHTSPVVPAGASELRLVQRYGELPLSFEANHGQTDSRVKLLARGSGYTLFLTGEDRKSTRLNSSHEWISYDVFC